MANYIFSYDLNGPRPSHAEMDKHLEKSGWDVRRVLETVWYIGTSASQKQISDYLKRILSKDDSYLVVLGEEAVLRNLLCGDDEFKRLWNRHRS